VANGTLTNKTSQSQNPVRFLLKGTTYPN